MINWYPGHMRKAFVMIEQNLKLVDALIYVLDARAPRSCLNPDFEPFIRRLPVVYALNKADLADRSVLNEWTAYLSGERSTALALTGTASKSTAPMLSALQKLCAGKIERFRLKGVKTTVKAMVLGVPNTGKSTLINTLCGDARAVTGNRPGVTRGKQWVRVGEFLEVLDTPGTLYPKLSDQTVARRLAYLGSIRDEVTDSEELASELLAELNEKIPQAISRRYGLAPGVCPDLVCVARTRGLLKKGNEPDTERAASAVLDDFRKGRIGAVTFERPGEKV